MIAPLTIFLAVVVIAAAVPITAANASSDKDLKDDLEDKICFDFPTRYCNVIDLGENAFLYVLAWGDEEDTWTANYIPKSQAKEIVENDSDEIELFNSSKK